MQKFTKYALSLVMAFFAIAASAVYAGEEEGNEAEIAVSLIADEETEYLLNTHSIVTIDQSVSAIKVSGLDQVMGDVTYAIYGQGKATLASGILSVNTIGYAEFAPVTFYEGNQYNVVITAGEETIFDGTVIGAAEPEVREISATIIAGEDEIALNTHSAFSAEMIKAIEASFDGFVPQQAGYSINTMVEVAGEESSSWEIDETIAQGALSLNGKGYAELEEAITLNAGTKYALIINADNESATFEINGAYAEQMEVEVTLVNGEEENVINGHSNVSVDVANAIKVNVINAPQATGISYIINEMNQNEDEEGTFWTVGKELAVGEANLNGMAYAEFEPIYFAQGTKYQVSVTVYDQNGEMGAPYIYEINGAFAEQNAIEVALLSGEENAFAILEGRDVTVDLPVNAIEVRGLDQVQDEIHYAIYGADKATLAEGILSVNTIGYAEFAPIALVSGVKYNVVLTANGETIYDAIVIGAADAAPAVEFWNDIVLLQDGAEIDLAETKSINVNVVLPDGVDSSADLFIEGMVYGKDGTADQFTGYTDFEDGVDVPISRLTPGNAYQIQITKIAYGEEIGYDEETYMPIYENQYVAEEGSALATLNFAIKEETPNVDAIVEVDGTTMNVIFPVGTDLGDNYVVKPYIIANGETIEVADHNIDNTTGEFFDPLNLIVINLNEELAAGDYTLVLPAGMFIVNGGDNNEEINIPFSIVDFSELKDMLADAQKIENPSQDIIDAIAAAYDVLDDPNATQADVDAAVKALKTATGVKTVVAAKNNGVIYNLAGQKVNAAKGIVIMNGKKFMVK